MMRMARLFKPSGARWIQPLQEELTPTWHLDPPCCCNCDEDCPFYNHRAHEPKVCIRACTTCWDAQKPLFA